MISPTTTPQLFGGTTGTASTGPKHDLDKDAFLRLLVAQLKHQDPTSPLQPYELAAQLAQFSTVEQLSNLNAAMLSQTDATNAAGLVGQTSLSASLLGRQIVAVGNQVSVPASGSASVHVDVGGSGGTAMLRLLDSTGATVATRSLGRLGAGEQDVALPSDLPQGDWHYALDVTGADGASVPVTTFTSGVVTGVEFKNDQISLFIGNLELSLADLQRIAAAPSGTPSSAPGSAPPPPLRPGQRGPLGGPQIVPDPLTRLSGVLTP